MWSKLNQFQPIELTILLAILMCLVCVYSHLLFVELTIDIGWFVASFTVIMLS